MPPLGIGLSRTNRVKKLPKIVQESDRDVNVIMEVQRAQKQNGSLSKMEETSAISYLRSDRQSIASKNSIKPTAVDHHHTDSEQNKRGSCFRLLTKARRIERAKSLGLDALEKIVDDFLQHGVGNWDEDSSRDCCQKRNRKRKNLKESLQKPCKEPKKGTGTEGRERTPIRTAEISEEKQPENEAKSSMNPITKFIHPFSLRYFNPNLESIYRNVKEVPVSSQLLGDLIIMAVLGCTVFMMAELSVLVAVTEVTSVGLGSARRFSAMLVAALFIFMGIFWLGHWMSSRRTKAWMLQLKTEAGSEVETEKKKDRIDRLRVAARAVGILIFSMLLSMLISYTEAAYQFVFEKT
ncbi:hypothetical protein HDU97_008851 [Phlyctochytrium planicorne]|nr:hypothetical protein HDU97_008851 [Phlyctochytrium planicorne]